MGGVANAVSSMFTAPGTNAAQGQEAQQAAAGKINSNLLNAWAPYVQSQMNFQQSQQPMAQAAVQGLGQFTTQGGRNQMSNTYAQNARGQAQTAASQTPAQFAGNPALGQAYGLSAYNNANQSANQYSQQINSPQGMAQAYQTYLGGLQSQAPDFSGISSLTGNIYSQPKVQVGQGLLGTLGQLAGPIGGMLSGGMLGSGAASSGGTSALTPMAAAAQGGYLAGVGNPSGSYGPYQPSAYSWMSNIGNQQP